ncbi:MAG: aspartate carbamoyltransferase [Streptosporangiales bacterium]|nr:aspartate carbamoyltransferase [Streptosporangiales bacterium]
MRRKSLILAVVALAALAVAGAVIASRGGPSRQAEVAEKGARVMPFDLERTTHRFTKTATGGVQTVVADDPGDTGQIRLIRSHLKDEAARFARGDFSDPTTIHGTDMPGVAELSSGHRGVTTRYADRPDGATLTYTTGDAGLRTALHAWFDAQVSDHGNHAEHGG